MAKKETGEDILRTILEKGGMNPISSSSIQNAIQDAGGTLKGSISAPLTQSGLIPPPPVTAEGSGSSKKSEALLENQKKTLEDIKKNTGNTAKMLDSLIKIQKTYNDDSKSLIKSLLESNEAQRIAVEENNRSKEASQEKVTGAVTAASNKSNENTSTGGQEKDGGGFLDKITTAATEMFGIKKAADVIGGGKNPTGPMSNAKPGPSIGSRLLRGGLYGGAAMAAYSLLGPDQKKALEEKGIDAETAGIVAGILGSGVLRSPVGAALTTAGALAYGATKFAQGEGGKQIYEMTKDNSLAGAMDPDLTMASHIFHGPKQSEEDMKKEKDMLKDAPLYTRMYGIGRSDYIRKKQVETNEPGAASDIGILGNGYRQEPQKINPPSRSFAITQEVTPSTENISQQQANEIYGDNNRDNVGFWKNTDQRRRTKLLEDAQKRGVTGINPHPEAGALTTTPTPKIEIPAGYETGSVQSRFNKITEEVMSTKPQSSAPVIINGGSTINNITTTSSGGGRGGGGGSPSRATNPWDSTLFGSKWEPYY